MVSVGVGVGWGCVEVEEGLQFGHVRVSVATSDRAKAARGGADLGDELGLQRSNRLPWNCICRESCLRVSQIELTSCWQSASAVRAQVWNASQWLPTRGEKKRAIRSTLEHWSRIDTTILAKTIQRFHKVGEQTLISMATASHRETIAQSNRAIIFSSRGPKCYILGL